MLPLESNHGDLLQKSIPTLTFWGNSHWIQCIFYILFFSEFYSPMSWHYPGEERRSLGETRVYKHINAMTPVSFNTSSFQFTLAVPSILNLYEIVAAQTWQHILASVSLVAAKFIDAFMAAAIEKLILLPWMNEIFFHSLWQLFLSK